jgi:hypothetical protein
MAAAIAGARNDIYYLHWRLGDQSGASNRLFSYSPPASGIDGPESIPRNANMQCRPALTTGLRRSLPWGESKGDRQNAYLDATFSSHTPLEIADVCHLCFFAPNKARSGAQTELLYCTNKQLRLGAHVSVFWTARVALLAHATEQVSGGTPESEVNHVSGPHADRDLRRGKSDYWPQVLDPEQIIFLQREVKSNGVEWILHWIYTSRLIKQGEVA